MSAEESTIYLDNNATTPVDPEVLKSMLPWLQEKFGNAASRTHAFGWEAEEAVEQARRLTAKVIAAKAKEIVWTSGATEATNLALKGLFDREGARKPHIVTCRTEHKATLDTLAHLEKIGARVTYLPVAESGLLDLAKLEASIESDTLAVSIMMVNNESGVIQDIAAIGKLCAQKAVVFHCDAAQAFGKLPIDVQSMGIHLLSVSGHKIYAPKGVGFLYVRAREPQIRIAEQIHGGGHEDGRRSGTLNVPFIVALGKAAEIAGKRMQDDHDQALILRDCLLAGLQELIPDLVVNGDLVQRIPGNLNLSLPGVESEALLMAMPNLAVSTGSACTSTSVEASYVLKAMGISDARALSAVRFGIGRFTTEDEIDRAVVMVADAVNSFRGRSVNVKN